MISGDWHTYFDKIKENFRDSTEHTFRTPLENLLNEIKPDKKVNIIHEQKREKGFGAPDFRIERNGAIVGYLETKPLNEDLDKVLKSEQIKKYLSVNPNLVLTNYREFILILDDKIIERTNLFFLTDLNQKRSQLKEENIVSIEQLIKKFFLSALPLNIGKGGNIKKSVKEDLGGVSYHSF